MEHKANVHNFHIRHARGARYAVWRNRARGRFGVCKRPRLHTNGGFSRRPGRQSRRPSCLLASSSKPARPDRARVGRAAAAAAVRDGARALRRRARRPRSAPLAGEPGLASAGEPLSSRATSSAHARR